MVFKMVRDRTEDGRDLKRGAVIKDNNWRLITESKEVLRICAAYFKELLNGKGVSRLPRAPELGWERGGSGGDMTGRSGNMNAQDEKGQGDRSRLSSARDYGDGWRGGSQLDRKATERVYARGKDTEGVEDGPDSADMEEERGCAWPRKVQGHHTTQPSIETVGEGFRRKDQAKSNLECYFREEQQGFRKRRGTT